MYERGAEHYDDLEKKRADSHMWKHWEIDHAGEEQEPQFKLKVVTTFQSSLDRQIAEAVRIRRRGAGVLNSKGVYNRCSLPRLVVEESKTDDGKEQDEPLLELPGDEWTRPRWMSRRKREEGEERADRPSKRSRNEWGLGEVAEEQQRMDFLISRSSGNKGAKMRQTELKTISEGEVIARWVLKDVLERVTEEVQIGNKQDNQYLNCAFTLYESQVPAIIAKIIEESVKKSEKKKELNTKAAPGKNVLTEWVTRSRKVNVKAEFNYQPNQNRNEVPPPKTNKTRQKQREFQLGARQLVRQLADLAIDRSEKKSTLNTEPTTTEKIKKASASFFPIFSMNSSKPVAQPQLNQKLNSKTQNQKFLKTRRTFNPNSLTKCKEGSRQSKLTHPRETGGGLIMKRKRERSPDRQSKRSKSKSVTKNRLITEFWGESLYKEH